MSLDVYLYTPTECPNCKHVIGDPQKIYGANITHNLTKMAREADVYYVLWHPARLDPALRVRIEEQEKVGNYHGPDGCYALENSVQIYARDLIERLTVGLALLKSDPERFKVFNPENGWGDYEGLVSFVKDYLDACETNPTATVTVSG